MKKITLLLSLLIIAIAGYVVIGQSSRSTKPKDEAREVREERRAARQAAMERQVDSMVLAHSFQFTPQTMQVQPAGGMNSLMNPNFEISIHNDAADIFLPYSRSMSPPYRHTILNCTVTPLLNYTSVQSEDGWHVSFQSNLYSGSTYTFTFDINSKFGTTTLTLRNNFYNTVQYAGVISRY